MSRWIRRYGPGEVLGFAAALVTFLALAPHGRAQAAIATAAAEGAGYYLPIVVRELRQARPLTRRRTAVVLAGLAAEFGPAELLDWFVRPATMFAAAAVVPFAAAAVLAGKLAADVCFYLVAVPLCAVVRTYLLPRLQPAV